MTFGHGYQCAKVGAYPPVSLPSKNLMEHAKRTREDELHLPALRFG